MSGGGRKARGQVPASGSDEDAMGDKQDVDMLVMENEILKRDMMDMEGRVKAEIASALEASRAEVKAELAAQIGVLMEALQKAQQGNNGNNGQNNDENGNVGQGHGEMGMSALEEKGAAETAVVATPARQNLGFIYGTNRVKV